MVTDPNVFGPPFEEVGRLTGLETGNTLYVNSVVGDDGYVGTSIAPLATIQEAINRFLPSHAEPQKWASDVTKKIIVQYSAGMAPIEESIYKPPHIGPGLLVIQGEELVLENLVQSGSGSLVSGHQGLTQINFTTTPLTPSSLDGYYMAGQTDVLFGNEAFADFESFPIVDNGDGYVHIPSKGIGVADGFGYVNAANLRIVKPQIIWRSDALEGGTFAPSPTHITNGGGPLMIRGFIFNPTNTQVYTLSDIGSADGALSSSTVMTRCDLDTTRIFTKIANGLSIHGCRVISDASTTFMQNVKRLRLERLYVMLTGSELQVNFCERIDFDGNYVERMSGGSTHFTITETRSTSIGKSDFRSGGDLRYVLSTGNVGNSTFEGCTSNCIEIDDDSFVNMISVSGNVNNTGYGVQVTDGSRLKDLGSNTITASLGDIKVGGAPVTTWGLLPLTDAVTLTRAE